MVAMVVIIMLSSLTGSWLLYNHHCECNNKQAPIVKVIEEYPENWHYVPNEGYKQKQTIKVSEPSSFILLAVALSFIIYKAK